MAEFGDPTPVRDQSGSESPNGDQDIAGAIIDERIELTEPSSHRQGSEDAVEV